MTVRTLMSRLGVVLIALGSAAVVVGPPAHAHNDMTHIEARWPTTDVPTVTDVVYRRAPSVNGLSGSMRAAMSSGASPWNQVGTSLQMGAGSDLANEPDPKDCGSNVNSLHAGPIDGAGGHLAQTWMCYVGPWPQFGEPGKMVHFSIVYDTAENWYAGTGVPGSGQVDLRSTSAHEFGHAAGWTRHLSTASAQCSGAPKHTMCPTMAPETTHLRTLETHDKHTFTAAY